MSLMQTRLSALKHLHGV